MKCDFFILINQRQAVDISSFNFDSFYFIKHFSIQTENSKPNDYCKKEFIHPVQFTNALEPLECKKFNSD